MKSIHVSLRKTAVFFLAVFIGISSCAYARSDKPSAEAEQVSEIEQKQRLNEQERVINRLMRFYDPFSAFRKNIENGFEPLGPDTSNMWLRYGASGLGRMNIVDKDQQIEVSLELPGMSKDELEVSLTGNLLTIKGEKRQEQETKGDDYYLQERQYGVVNRMVRLPDGVEADKITSRFENGVLTLVAPKQKSVTEKPQTRQIPVTGT